jgi:hypothetical protein
VAAQGKAASGLQQAKSAHTGQWSLPCCSGQMSPPATHTAAGAAVDTGWEPLLMPSLRPLPPPPLLPASPAGGWPTLRPAVSTKSIRLP